ncbi:MAG: CaiB/BaiF CoA-transferase family protein [Promethearchaeota archaeon]
MLDLSRLLPGPYGTMLLADLGADVVRIEEPGFGDLVHWAPPFLEAPSGPKRRRSALDLLLNRNKRSVALNLKVPEGLRIFLELAKGADVVVESFRPGVAERLGVDYESLRRENPKLVYVSLTGYGQTGPYSPLPGHDLNYVAVAGVLGATGPVECPVVPAPQVADVGGGALMVVVGTLTALLARERTGEGQHVDASMTDAAAFFLPLAWTSLFAEGPPKLRRSDWSLGGEPYYDVYLTADDKFFSLALIEKKFWEGFCDAVGAPDLRNSQFSKDEAEREALRQRLSNIIRGKTREQWFEFFKEHDLPGAPVYDLHEVPDDPHVKERGVFRRVPHPDLGEVATLGFPLKFSGCDPGFRQHAPTLGQHTEEVLAEVLPALGMDRSDLKRLKRRGVVGLG